MTLLILTAHYHPFIHPRAYRWTALAEHWAAAGHEVHVLTARAGDAEAQTMLHGVHVYRVGYDSLKEWVYQRFGIKKARGRVGVAPGKPGRLQQILEWGYRWIWKKLYFPDDACIWYFPAKRRLRQLLEQQPFDALITVSLPFTDHLLGLEVRRHYPTLRWLADIGDPFSERSVAPNNTWLYQKMNHRLERRVLATADAVVVTTAATKQLYNNLFGTGVSNKITVIPPLLREPDAVPISPAPASATVMAYFGALYAPTRTPEVLLNLLDRTFLCRPEWKDTLKMHFYGEIFPEFYKLLSAQPGIQLHGLCSRAQAWAAMRAADILVNIGNKTDFQLPSKAVDYLAAGKPVLNLSFVENDPFAVFFDGNPLVFNLKVDNGVVSETEFLRWLRWLDSEKPAPDDAALQTLTQPYRVKTLGVAYLSLLRPTVHG